VPIVDVASLLSHLSLPFVLLVSHSVQHAGSLLLRGRHLVAFVLVDVLLVALTRAAADQRFEAHQEQHVHHQQRHSPQNYNNNHLEIGYIIKRVLDWLILFVYFNRCGVAAFVFAFASGAELLLFAFDEVAYFGQHHRVAVALVGRHISYVVFAVGLRRRVHH
jgi:hypothetical protein